MMHKALHPRDGRLYESKKKGRRGLANIGDSVEAPIRRSEDNIKKTN